MPHSIPLKQNVQWLRTLAGLLDERAYDTSVEILRQGDTITLQLVARHRSGDKIEANDTAQRLRKSLHKWKAQAQQETE